MKQLTDAMIEKALQNKAYMNDDNTLMIVIMVIATIFLGSIFFISRNTRQKIGAGGSLILLLILSFAVINQNGSMAKAINNGSWEVHTDIVDRVMESTDDDGDKDYFMVLKTYGRVSLDSYAEAMQYYSGQRVYIIVVPKGSGYKDTGVAYPTDVYTYVGSH
jgi:hypothetical protein